VGLFFSPVTTQGNPLYAPGYLKGMLIMSTRDFLMCLVAYHYSHSCLFNLDTSVKMSKIKTYIVTKSI
jgi:hypothetical protein